MNKQDTKTTRVLKGTKRVKGNGPEFDRTLTEPIPTELYSKLYQVGVIKDLLSEPDYLRFEQLMKYRKELAIIYLIQLFNGCRINEVLKLKWSDSFMNVAFISEGSKGSNARLLILPGFEMLLERKRESNLNLGYGLNYNSIHRIYLKFGIFLDAKGMKRKIVTHSLRYRFVDLLDKQNTKLEDIKSIIGHKVSKSTEHYLRGLLKLKSIREK
jgi:integrase